jgi:transposase-like protein
MAWKTSSALEEKVRFVMEYERDEATMRELCARFGVSRETGYVWLRRYQRSGVAGLLEQNRAPHRHPNQTREEVERAVLELDQVPVLGSRASLPSTPRQKQKPS